MMSNSGEQTATTGPVVEVEGVRWMRQYVEDADGGAGAIDLEAEDVFAGELEEDEWLVLAREKVDAGEYRLAIRALFLACLATLSERKLVRLERSKTNRDYQRELELKARGERGVQSDFVASTVAFEETWYGDHEAGPPQVDRVQGYFRRLAGREEVER